MKRSVRKLMRDGRVVAACGSLTLGLLTSAADAQDTVRVNSNAAPVWGPSIKLTLTKELGQLDGADEYSFGRVSNVVFDKSGRMYTYDEQDTRIRQYDASFKFVREIGRSGAGPGEYEDVVSLTFVDDTVLVVKDYGLARVSFFYPNGRLRGSITNKGFGSVGFQDFTVDSEGLLTFKALRNDPALARAQSANERRRYSQLKRLRVDGTLVDSLSIPPSRLVTENKFTIGTWGGGSNFIPETRFSVLRSGGFVVGDGAPYRFMIRPLKGPVRVVERPWTPLKLGAEERSNWLEWVEYFEERSRKSPGTAGPEKYTIPNTKPAFKEIFTDEDSRIWVSVYAPARKVKVPPRVGSVGPLLTWRQSETYDVFSNQGVYLGRVVMPDGLSMGRSKGNRIWLTTSGPNDEQVIRIYTMTGNGALKP